MKAIVLNRVGKLSDLQYVGDRRIPVPREGELRVKVQAVGLNPVDYKLALGWGGVQWEEPPVLGLDVAGIVDKVGIGVSQFAEGDRVYYHGNLSRVDGGYAEYACGPAYAMAKIPDGLAMEEAAALPCSGFTAYQAVMLKLRVQEGKSILIHAGSGGVGGYAIQLAKLKKLQVFSTCSTNNIAYVESLGADTVLDYSQYNIYEKVMEATDGRGVDYVVNTVDSETATQDIDVLAFHGELAAIVEHPDFTRLQFYEKAMSLHEVALGGAHANGDSIAKKQLGEIAAEFANLVITKKIAPLPIECISIKEIPSYLSKLEKRHVSGKIVAVICDAD